MNRKQLTAMIDAFSIRAEYHHRCAELLEIKRVRNRDDSALERDKHRILCGMCLDMVAAYEAAHNVTEK